MAPALTASAAMLARRQLTRAASASTSTAPSSAVLVACRAMAQQRGYATPSGPPPQKFRTSKRVEWAWDRESTLDRMGKFFLMTEMARGMYVLLEQFFRAPYVTTFTCANAANKTLPAFFGSYSGLTNVTNPDTPSTTPSRRYEPNEQHTPIAATPDGLCLSNSK